MNFKGDLFLGHPVVFVWGSGGGGAIVFIDSRNDQRHDSQSPKFGNGAVFWLERMCICKDSLQIWYITSQEMYSRICIFKVYSFNVKERQSRMQSTKGWPLLTRLFSMSSSAGLDSANLPATSSSISFWSFFDGTGSTSWSTLMILMISRGPASVFGVTGLVVVVGSGPNCVGLMLQLSV